MTLASIDPSSSTASSAKVDFLATPSSANARPENSEFGQIMSGVMQSVAETPTQTAGQEVAVSLALEPGFPGSFGGNLGASLGGDFLKAVNLGPYMNVITSEATVPDEQSLEAFARSQGLDETAVQWLMGNSPAVTAPVSPPMPSMASNGMPIQPTTAPELTSALGSTSLLGEAKTPNPAGLSVQLNATASSSNPMAQLPGASDMSGPALQGGVRRDSLMVASDPTRPMESLELPLANLTVAAPNSGSNGLAGTGNIEDVLVLPNTLSAAALWAMAQGTEKARVTPPAPEDPTELAKVQINLMASAAPAAFWMLRNSMAAAPTKEAPTTPYAVALSEIDLSQEASSELLDSLSQALAEGASLQTAAAAGDHPAPVSGHSGQRADVAAAARQDAQNSDATASAPDSGNAQRSEKVQNLAEKMGQAVGQRILSEIEKGQWHLKLSLRPATLGHIEVEMRMRSGELDTVFTAPQALTRELLQEGMSKLKDTLSQMGMNVASMQVGDGQTQKRGGESTRGQMSKSTNSNANDPQSSLSAAQTSAPRMKMGQDGWDVLV